jgi:hypothetical protein
MIFGNVWERNIPELSKIISTGFKKNYKYSSVVAFWLTLLTFFLPIPFILRKGFSIGILSGIEAREIIRFSDLPRWDNLDALLL